MDLEEQVVSLELSRELKKNGYIQEGLWWWVNSDISYGFEGDERIWLCDGKWSLYNFIPNPEFDETGKITKEEGLIPDSFFGDKYDREKYEEYQNKIRPTKIKAIEVYVAPTCSELGERLPIKNYEESQKFREEEIVTTKHYSFYHGKVQYNCCLESTNRDYKIVKKEITADTEANARAKMWIYLKKKGLICPKSK